jgi:hypothetical protein
MYQQLVPRKKPLHCSSLRAIIKVSAVLYGQNSKRSASATECSHGQCVDHVGESVTLGVQTLVPSWGSIPDHSKIGLWHRSQLGEGGGRRQVSKKYGPGWREVDGPM